MSPREGAKALAIARVAFGAGLVLFPRRLGKGWLGEVAGRGAVRSVLRGLGVRDVVIGMIAMHTLENPQVGPRWQKTCAVCDGVDALAALMAARDLPVRGALGVMVLGGGSAAASIYFAGQLAASVE